MTICPYRGYACTCQPDEGIPCSATADEMRVRIDALRATAAASPTVQKHQHDWRLAAAQFIHDEIEQREGRGWANRVNELEGLAMKLEMLASASPFGLDFAGPTVDTCRQPSESHPAPDEYVAIPMGAGQAALMVLLGTQYLKDNAPERLRPSPAREPLTDARILEIAGTEEISGDQLITFARDVLAAAGAGEKT